MGGMPQQYGMVRQEDSIFTEELQAVDFFAWAMFQKYVRGESRFYERIVPIIVEEVITKQVWEQEQKRKAISDHL